MVQQLEFFQVSLLNSVRNMFLSKAFSMSEMNIYQILRLNYYKEQKGWWTEIEWSISKKQRNGRVYETNNEDKEHHFDYCFEIDTNAKSRFVRLFFNRLSKIKKLSVVYITKYQKENNKNVYFGNFPFH